ncbi:MAG: hypothetical protein ACRELY_13225 [Polyangiaceae bacterium]
MKHDTSSRASALLRKASPAFEPSSADRKQTRAAIRRRIAVGIAASAAVSGATKTAAAAPSVAPAAIAGGAVATGGTSLGAAATATGAGLGFATKIVAAVAIIGSVSAGAVTVHRASQAKSAVMQTAQKQTEATTSTEAKTTTPTTITTTATETATETTNPVAGPVSDLENRPSTVDIDHRPRPSTSTIDHRPSTSTIEDRPATVANSLQVTAEVDLLRRAQEALNDGDANAALALLDEHARKYPNGALAEEREAARVVALCAANRVDDARATAQSFSTAHPQSPFAARIAASCAGTSSTSSGP